MKFPVFIGVLALIGIATGFYQHHEISALRNAIAAEKENAQRPAQTEVIEPATVDPQELDRLRADKLALMKLRSEISELRKMGEYSPAQIETQLNNTRSELAREQKREEGLAAKRKSYLFGKLAKAAFKQAQGGLYQLLAGDSNLLPQSSEDLKNRIDALPEYNPYRDQLLPLISPTNQFGIPQFIEVLPSRKLTNRNASLTLRERQPRQLPDGRWARYYASTDGQVNEVILPDQNFDEWEQQFK